MKSQKSFKECEILNLGVRKAIPTESRSTNHKLKNNKYHLNIKEILLLIKKPTNLKYKWHTWKQIFATHGYNLPDI